MFILLLTLLLLPFLCLGSLWYINDTIPEVVKESFSKTCSSYLPLILKVIMWILRILQRARTTYVWEKRSHLPKLGRAFVDKCLSIDSRQADLCVSDGVGSIQMNEAVATHEGVDYDVVDMMDMIWILGDGESTEFNLQRVLGYENVLVKSESEITLRVSYTGHRNTKKKSPPQTYSVRYNGGASDVARFPPYPASEGVKKGLGVVKITGAKRHDDVCCLLEARESAGLHGKFYIDVKDTETLVPGVVNFLGESQRIHEDLQIKIDTSKGVIEFNQGSKLF